MWKPPLAVINRSMEEVLTEALLDQADEVVGIEVDGAGPLSPTKFREAIEIPGGWCWSSRRLEKVWEPGAAAIAGNCLLPYFADSRPGIRAFVVWRGLLYVSGAS